MRGRRGDRSVSKPRGRSGGSWSTRVTRTRSMWRRWAMSTAAMPSAGSIARPTAARTGRKSSPAKTIRRTWARWIWRSTRSSRKRCMRRSGPRGVRHGRCMRPRTCPAAACINRPTAARTGPGWRAGCRTTTSSARSALRSRRAIRSACGRWWTIPARPLRVRCAPRRVRRNPSRRLSPWAASIAPTMPVQPGPGSTRSSGCGDAGGTSSQ